MPNQQPNKMWSGRFREPLNRTFEQWQRSFPRDWRCPGMPWVMPSAVCLLGLCFPASAQTTQPAPDSARAHVTFYSPHVTIAGGLSKGHPGAFKGRLFFEDDQLAFMEPGHFVTFLLPPGPHIFSATTWMAKHADTGAHITLNLAPGQHYFVQTSTHNVGIVGVEFEIKEVPCDIATKENVNNKPLEPSHLRPFGKPLASHNTAFPSCS